MVTKHWQHGLRNEHEFNTMKSLIVRKLGKLHLKSPFGKMPKISDMLHQIKLFDEFPLKDLKKIEKIMVTKMYNPNQELFQANGKTDGFYVILRGSVLEKRITEEKEEYTFEHKTGGLVGI